VEASFRLYRRRSQDRCELAQDGTPKSASATTWLAAGGLVRSGKRRRTDSPLRSPLPESTAYGAPVPHYSR
jgi:hypothetical protein